MYLNDSIYSLYSQCYLCLTRFCEGIYISKENKERYRELTLPENGGEIH